MSAPTDAPRDGGFDEDALLPLSALQHLLFCERQAVLIHVEGQWADNALTVEGTHLHQRVDEAGPRLDSRGDLRVVRGLALRSPRLGLIGRADVVEFHRVEPPAVGARLPRARGLWRPFPVEYKRGRPKPDLSDRVQLCAQALCLEEMLEVEVPSGAIFYGKPRRRLEVELDPELRAATEEAAQRMHALLASGQRPRVVREPKCERCSLLEICLPDAVGATKSASSYLATTLRAMDREALEP